ncbi:ABC transporter permease [Paenibacillus gansuensis]|uniref:ABC transporter permease n=1 Tax=Paenibacillus gansuensis TaxID=306542 RepID=A0ABW5P7M5_9BACL
MNHSALPVRRPSGTPGARKRWKSLWNSRILLLMCLPALAFFLVFAYIPMPGVYIAFVNYMYNKGIFGSPFVGLDNFKFLFISGDLWRLTTNTVLYNLAFILVGNVVQIGLALLFNELRSRTFRNISQSLMILPYFISPVLIGLFAYSFLSYDYGLLNKLLSAAGYTPLEAYSTPWIWPFIIIFTFLWQGAGYGTIIYFASIMSVESEVLEASNIDGANGLQRIRYILLPHLKPTFIILLLFSMGGIMKGNFGLFYNLVGASNTMLYENTDIIETFVFRALMRENNFSLASAVSLYQSVVGFALVLAANWVVKKIDKDYSLF